MLAPVVLFVYNRPDHTTQTIEALSRNELAAASELFIFADGAKNENSRRAVDDTRRLLKDISGFSSVTVVERPVNLGLAQSVITGVAEIFRTYESVIVLEDDLVTSRYFLSFMNEALLAYRDDPLAFSITGHVFPRTFLSIPADYPYDVFSGYRCSSWTWATWRDRWPLIDWDMQFYDAFRNCPLAVETFNRGGADLTEMLRQQRDGEIDTWDIQFCYAHYAHDMRCIYPVETLAQNIGLDNSGTHSTPNPRYSHAHLNDAWHPKLFCPAAHMDDRISTSFRSIFDPETPEDEGDKSPRPSAPKASFQWARRLLKRFGVSATSISSGGIALTAPRPETATGQVTEVLFVNTFQGVGGAARAAYRIFLGVTRLYPSAQFVCLLKQEAKGVFGFAEGTRESAHVQNLVECDQKRLELYPNRAMSFFSPGASANPLRTRLDCFSPDLVHLHWVAMTMLRVEDLTELKVPLIWTLHDTWAFTGGCHYVGACRRFEAACGECPQLGSSREEDLSRSLWARKQNAYQNLDLTVVTPTEWLAALARKASLFDGRRIEVIPNGINTNLFKPHDRKHARRAFSLDPTKPVVLFGAHVLDDKRKGFDLLVEALRQIDFHCILAIFGVGLMEMQVGGHVTVRAVGEIENEEKLAKLYSAADVFVCPSREDNLPNTVAEALACGTPCVGFRAGGLPEMIDHRSNGWLAEPFDPMELAEGIRWVTQHPQPQSLRSAARTKAVADYDLDVTSERYSALYEDIKAARHKDA